MLFWKKYLRLSAVRKVLETLLFQALGSFETLDSKLSHGTSSKFADVRTHLRKVSKKALSLVFCTGKIIKEGIEFFNQLKR